MKHLLKNWLPAVVFVMAFGGATLTIATPAPAHAACLERVLTFPAWYKGLLDDKCNVKAPQSSTDLSSFIWKVALNVVEFMLQLVGYLAVGFIITGGYKYMTATGVAEDLVKARKTILNAVIGLVISLFSIGIVNAVAGAF